MVESRAQYLGEIRRLLAKADDEALRRVIELLQQATDPATYQGRFVGIGDLRSFSQEEFGDTWYVEAIWQSLLLAEHGVLDVRHNDSELVRRSEREVSQFHPALDAWVISVESIQALARSFMPGSITSESLDNRRLGMTKHQQTAFIAWAASL